MLSIRKRTSTATHNASLLAVDLTRTPEIKCCAIAGRSAGMRKCAKLARTVLKRLMITALLRRRKWTVLSENGRLIQLVRNASVERCFKDHVSGFGHADGFRLSLTLRLRQLSGFACQLAAPGPTFRLELEFSSNLKLSLTRRS
jgi:hypothetical protein